MNNNDNTKYDIDKFNRIILLNRKEFQSYLGTLIINTDRDDEFEYSITEETDECIKNPKFIKASRFVKDTYIYQKNSPKVLIIRSCNEEKIKATITINAQPLVIGDSLESQIKTGVLESANSSTDTRNWYEKSEYVILAIVIILLIYLLMSNKRGNLFVD